MRNDPSINLHLGCSLAAMREMQDNQYDLAIVDPPYFKEYAKEGYQGKHISTTGIKRENKLIKNWQVPTRDYFEQLFRVSKKQIVWGANYYPQYLPAGRIVWDKKNDDSTFSQAEIASISRYTKVFIFRYLWNGMLQEDMKNKEIRIHPTQKPIELYKWQLQKFAKEGDKILDTHLGSGSIACACYDLGFDLDAWEIDPEYFERTLARYTEHSRQSKLF